ncbi:MAG TPA: PQQ-binding-like beta-propeller repeat protein [Hyphomicrobiaceae bacterium]|nr:PQQ-binding-like beta-propeller repeat protein [Hyphomicrobiaceae bacterium]
MVERSKPSSLALRGSCLGAIVASGLLAAGCSDSLPSMPRFSDLNPFAEKQVPLPGKRVPVSLAEGKMGADLASGDRPVILPPTIANDAWTQPGGVATNAPGHLALGSSIKVTWSSDAGQGSSSRGRLISSPIVAEGRVFTLDTAALVTAFNAASGAIVWRSSLTPENEKGGKGAGGGLAFEGGRLYAATGYGNVVAIDPASGKKLWEKSLGSPVRASPTAHGGRVYILALDGVLYTLNGADGTEAWVHKGLPEKASIVSNSSPAVDGTSVVIPYPTGELVTVNATNGAQTWSESLARARVASSLTAMSDAARPAIDNGVVFAVGHAGRMVAASARTGERLWTINVPSIQAPWVAGETVFVVDTSGQLMALTRREGRAVWTVKLPGGSIWSGPVLAGGRLWLVSDKGTLVGVEAVTGRVDVQQNLGAPSFISPIVAGGRMYVLTDKARLIALN